MKSYFLFILFLTLLPITTAAQVNVNVNAIYKAVEDAKRKHRAQMAQEQQQQQQIQNIQTKANNAVTQSQQAANQMANTDHTELLKQAGSVRPTQISGGANLSKVKNKMTFGGKDGNTVTPISNNKNAPSTISKENANNEKHSTKNGTILNDTSESQGTEQDNEIIFNKEGNSYTPTYKNVTDFSKQANTTESTRPERKPAGISEARYATVRTDIPDIKRKIMEQVSTETLGRNNQPSDEVNGCIDVKLPEGYLPLGTPGKITDAKATYKYLTDRQDLASPCAKIYCVSQLVDEWYVVNEGVPGRVPGTCNLPKKTKTKPRNTPITQQPLENANPQPTINTSKKASNNTTQTARPIAQTKTIFPANQKPTSKSQQTNSTKKSPSPKSNKTSKSN